MKSQRDVLPISALKLELRPFTMTIRFPAKLLNVGLLIPAGNVLSKPLVAENVEVGGR